MEPTQQGLFLATNPLRLVACGYVAGELATMSFPLNSDVAATLGMALLAQVQLGDQFENAARDTDFLRQAGVSLQ